MIRKDRKAELRMLAFNQGLRHETYNLINKQFERELQRHPPKNIEEKIFEDKPVDYPNVLTINEPENWEESKNNLKTRLDKSNPVTIHVINYNTSDDEEEPNKIYVSTDIYGVFRYVINKEKSISSTRAVKIQAGLTIQIEKHSKSL
jgi:hypothetical protein